ncbi:hypothetical protein Tco_1137397, partial [Tanacetum coccineum]
MKKMMEAVIPIRKTFVKMKFLMAVRLRDLWCLDVEVDVRSDWQLVEKAIGGSDWISVVTRFGVPATIITENETQLINDPFKSWAEGLGKKLVSTPIEQRLRLATEKRYSVWHMVGEFVLQKNELSKVENTGKLGPKWEGPYEVVETYGTGAYKLRSMDGAEVP